MHSQFLAIAAKNLRKKRMRDITATDIQKLYNQLVGYSQSYINKFTCTIRGVFKAALQDGIILRDPTVTPQTPNNYCNQYFSA